MGKLLLIDEASKILKNSDLNRLNTKNIFIFLKYLRKLTSLDKKIFKLNKANKYRVIKEKFYLDLAGLYLIKKEHEAIKNNNKNLMKIVSIYTLELIKDLSKFKKRIHLNKDFICTLTQSEVIQLLLKYMPISDMPKELDFIPKTKEDLNLINSLTDDDFTKSKGKVLKLDDYKK